MSARQKLSAVKRRKKDAKNTQPNKSTKANTRNLIRLLLAATNVFAFEIKI